MLTGAQVRVDDGFAAHHGHRFGQLGHGESAVAGQFQGPVGVFGRCHDFGRRSRIVPAWRRSDTPFPGAAEVHAGGEVGGEVLGVVFDVPAVAQNDRG